MNHLSGLCSHTFITMCVFTQYESTQLWCSFPLKCVKKKKDYKRKYKSHIIQAVPWMNSGDLVELCAMTMQVLYHDILTTYHFKSSV